LRDAYFVPILKFLIFFVNIQIFHSEIFIETQIYLIKHITQECIFPVDNICHLRLETKCIQS